jgi:hypothetical protein
MRRPDTEDLIETLTAGLKPVRPLAAPAYRAAGWLLLVILVLGALIAARANLSVFAARHSEPRMMLQVIATLLTGLTAVVAAFYLCLPEASTAWRYVALPPLVLWLVTSGLGCLHYGWGLGVPGDRFGESTHCLRFIVGLSVPLCAFLLFALRRARPLQPLPVLAVGALGVAGLAAFALEFFHPFDTTALDFAVHLVAIAVVIAATLGFRRFVAAA